MSNAATNPIPTRREARIAGTLEHAPSITITLRTNPKDEGKEVWIQIAKPGKFKGHAAGHFEMNAMVFAQIIANFEAQGNKFIPVDFEHASEQAPTEGSIPTLGAPAQGWITRLEMRADGNLWGLVSWGDLARTYIKAGQYRYLSPAIVFGSKDRVTGRPCGARLSSVALTNNPYLDAMAPVTAKAGTAAPSTAVSDDVEQKPDAVEATADAPITPETEAKQAPDADDLAALAEDDEHGFPKYYSVIVGLHEALEAAELRACTAETALEETRARLAVLEDAEVASTVDAAMSVWGEKRGLTSDMRPILLKQAKDDAQGFAAMYPKVRPGSFAQPHHGKLIAAGAHRVAPDATETQAIAMSAAAAAVPSIETLAEGFIAAAKAKGIEMSREEAFSKGFTERQRLTTEARKRAQ